MTAAQEHTRSPWMEVPVLRGAPSLRGDLETDVLVVGAGISGLSVAYELLARGRQVTVVDRGAIGMGMTARTTAHLSSISDDGYAEFITRRGEEMARLFHESHASAIARIAQIVNVEKIDCGFRRCDGVLFPGDARGAAKIEKELDAAQRLGIEAFRQQGVALDGLQAVTALCYPGQATFHPTRYLAGLARAVVGRGGEIFADTTVTAVQEKDGGVVAETPDGNTIRARCGVVATNAPINDLIAIHTKQAPYRTYAIALEMPKGALPDALYWDTLDPYHYVRLAESGGQSLVIIGGEDHKTGEFDDGAHRFLQLEEWSRGMLPQAGRVTHRWSGQVMEPVDDAAFIGLDPGSSNIFVATGDSGQGMTHGALAGLLIVELIVSGQHRWQPLYEPSRKIRKGLGAYVSENAMAVKNYAEMLLPGEVSSADEIGRGQGAVMREGLHLVAVSRDADGVLHRVSANCTHAGCVVHWNGTERCWDCPCHGSHFAPDGSVLNGPAVKPLPPAGG